jgi:hypothetical protein
MQEVGSEIVGGCGKNMKEQSESKMVLQLIILPAFTLNLLLRFEVSKLNDGNNFTLKKWLPSLDSNQGKRVQSPSCYRYTTRQCAMKYSISFFSRQTGIEDRRSDHRPGVAA